MEKLAELVLAITVCLGNVVGEGVAVGTKVVDIARGALGTVEPGGPAPVFVASHIGVCE